MRIRNTILALPALLVASAQDTYIPVGSKVCIAPMGGFETALAAGIVKKKVPIRVVASCEQADFEIQGVLSEQRSGLWRTLLLWQYGSKIDTSIQVVNLKTQAIAFAYNYEMKSTRLQSAAESCAKHLKRKIERGGG